MQQVYFLQHIIPAFTDHEKSILGLSHIFFTSNCNILSPNNPFHLYYFLNISNAAHTYKVSYPNEACVTDRNLKSRFTIPHWQHAAVYFINGKMEVHESPKKNVQTKRVSGDNQNTRLIFPM